MEAIEKTPPTPEAINLDNHPCFNREACSSFGRVHLPVAPKCNIMCNYCNRDYDCVNESRPGVTSTVLSPGQALAYLEKIMEKRQDIAVVGIAGPGDPFANPEETMETFRLVRQRFPSMILCLSTNGLGLTEDYVKELAELKVSHVTITMNATDPEVAGQVYAWARHEKRIFRGTQAGELMISKQLQAIRWIKQYGMIAKVNSIIVPGINDEHIPEIAKEVGSMGADIMNCIPLLPTADTAFEHLPEPDAKMRFALRLKCGEHMNQMTHCARCRADAIGKLSEPMQDEAFELIQSCAKLPLNPQQERPCVAVATREGMLVNQHLGEAEVFSIYRVDPEDEEEFEFVETRPAPPLGGRDDRWAQLAESLKDCRALLAAAAGPSPKESLKKAGIKVIEMEGMVDVGLSHVFHGEELPPTLMRSFKSCGAGVTCGGDGTGCG
ncbi:radical SAM protein [Pelagicoccus sp. SDUM812003]|uniref:radical SAM protein n=1 Tax=Pelagicoccus sp. SDUM812003 TaxID=3041267 RepID=UPI00281066D5|nr:radical SAM protein [Pelagicoccus sp. SDUM812003]MDQ8203645.1 radical SAM protein [Pelagicoccus sp. SDUM812003]